MTHEKLVSKMAVVTIVLTSLLFLAGPGFAASVYYVDGEAAAGGSGMSWPAAFDDLQDALAIAAPGDEIWVAAGQYTPDGPGGDRAATFALPSGVAVYGGFAGTEKSRDERDPVANESVLSGDLNGDDIGVLRGNDENSYHVVTVVAADADTRIDGVTITRGHANGESGTTCFGGAQHGLACGDDGDCPDGTCVSVDSLGAGLLVFDSLFTIENCRIVENLAAFQGGGALLLEDVRAAIFIDGQAVRTNTATFTNSTFSNNTAGLTIANEFGDVIISNCVVWGGSMAGTGSFAVSYSNVQGGHPGEGNIDALPLFVDAAAGDVRLAAGSPAIDAGNNAAVPVGVTTDLAGHSRFVDDPETVDTGLGLPPLVDMGAYERQVCLADIDGSGAVDFGDLLMILSAWGPCARCAEDLDSDGQVDFGDLLEVLNSWGEC